MTGDVEKSLDLYIRMCSLGVTAESLPDWAWSLQRRTPSPDGKPADGRGRGAGGENHYADLRNV